MFSPLEFCRLQFAGPGVPFVALVKRANRRLAVRLVSLQSPSPRVTADFPVRSMYEGSHVQDEFPHRVFIACHVN